MENKTIHKLLINYIDDPVIPMRSKIDEKRLEDLAGSIQRVGLIQPITVRKVGDRFEVVSGHRRLAAHKLLCRETIDAIVIEADDKQNDALKAHENLFREDINPVDQAVFIDRLMVGSSLSVKEVADVLNRSETWVYNRLNILTFPDYLRGYVGEGKLSIGAATHLSKIKDEVLRRDYSRIAAVQGINANRAMFWSKQAEINRLPADTSQAPELPVEEAPLDSPLLTHCAFCGYEGNILEMKLLHSHSKCLIEFQKAMSDIEDKVDTSISKKELDY